MHASSLSSSGVSSVNTAQRASSRSARFTTLMTLLIIVLAIVAGLANVFVGTRNDKREYSPNSFEPDGAAALATLLEQTGVKVVHVQTESDLASADESTTVLITSPSVFTHSSYFKTGTDSDDDDDSEARNSLDTLLNSGATIILLGTDYFWDGSVWGFSSDSWTTENYDDDAPLSTAALTEQHCASDLPLIDDDADGSTIAPVNQLLIPFNCQESCFDTPDGTTAWVRSEEYPNVYYFGASAILTNEYLSKYDNAGVAMRMLGGTEKLLWVEGYAPASSEEAEVTGSLPAWFTLAFIAVMFSGLWLAAWRWRRFGKLVAEPLPVVVPAQEADEGRARMYRSGGDAAHAGRVMRSGFISRYASRLGLSAHSSPDAVIHAFADYLGVDEQTIIQALYSPVNTDSDLARVASALGTLEKEFSYVRTQ